MLISGITKNDRADLSFIQDAVYVLIKVKILRVGGCVCGGNLTNLSIDQQHLHSIALHMLESNKYRAG